MEISLELKTAIELARNAGTVILEHYAQEIIAEEKLGIDDFWEPVTAADRAASRLILRFGKSFRMTGSSKKKLTESKYGSQRNALDNRPIDGTSGFVKKDGDFAVQIGWQ